MPLGVYIAVPFCKSKCSFCNFAAGVFSRDLLQSFVDRVCDHIARTEETAASLGVALEHEVDTIYLGGGTPTTLEPEQLSGLLSCVRNHFRVTDAAD